MRTIFILLTKYSDWISSLLYYISGFGYTHSSIGLEENENCFYSFNYRGFAVETVDKHRRRGVRKSMCFQIQVPEAVYEDIKSRIEEFKEHKNQYEYSRMGVVLALLHIPHQWEKRYFCSQFVAQLLVQSHAVALRRNASLYLPNQLRPELSRCADLKEIRYNVV